MSWRGRDWGEDGFLSAACQRSPADAPSEGGGRGVRAARGPASFLKINTAAGFTIRKKKVNARMQTS